MENLANGLRSIDCSQSTLCFEIVKGLPAAFVALVIGCVATYVAWRQYLTARAKLKLDLFEKRYAVFEKTWSHLSEAIQSAPATTLLSDFNNVIPQARFLFGPEVEAYLNEISSKIIKLRIIHSKIEASCNVMPPEDIEGYVELMEWFHAQATVGVKRVFDPWLDLKKWR